MEMSSEPSEYVIRIQSDTNQKLEEESHTITNSHANYLNPNNMGNFTQSVGSLKSLVNSQLKPDLTEAGRISLAIPHRNYSHADIRSHHSD